MLKKLSIVNSQSEAILSRYHGDRHSLKIGSLAQTKSAESDHLNSQTGSVDASNGSEIISIRDHTTPLSPKLKYPQVESMNNDARNVAKHHTEDLVYSLPTDFVPVHVVSSLIPELFYDVFPHLLKKYRENLYRCIWCRSEDYVGLKTFPAFAKLETLINHYISKHPDIPISEYNVQCNKCDAYFYHEEKCHTHMKRGNCFQVTDDLFEPKYISLTNEFEMQCCEFCDMVFLSVSRYQKHIKKAQLGQGCMFVGIEHPREMGLFDYIKCKFCDEKFMHEQDYRTHVTNYKMTRKPKEQTNIEQDESYYDGCSDMRGNNSFKCRTVSLNEKFSRCCTLCNQLYTNSNIFQEHIKFDHKPEDFNLKCGDCGRYFTCQRTFQAHENQTKTFGKCFDFESCRTIPSTPKELRKRRCPVCPDYGQTFSLKRLREHIVKVHPDFKTDMKCPKCQKEFLSEFEFDDHMTQWKCLFCEELFPTRSTLTKHCFQNHRVVTSKENHSSIRFCCKVCGRNMSSLEHRKLHMKSKHNCLQTCPMCGEANGNGINMKNHLQTAHAYKTPKLPSQCFYCKICDNKVAYRTKVTLERHISDVHEKNKCAKCDICNKEFSQKATMLRHRRIHVDLKPFKCSVCELSFTQKTGMKAHRARHYNGDGSLKSPEEIKEQVEIIKEQRRKIAVNDNKSKVAGKKSIKSKKDDEDDIDHGASHSKVLRKKTPKNESRNKNDKDSPRQGRKYESFKKKKTRSKEKPAFQKCNDCNRTFRTQKALENHDCKSMESKQLQSYSFHCERCDKSFATEARKANHRCSASKIPAFSQDPEKGSSSDESEYSTNDAPSFLDYEGGFNCIKCKAFFNDLTVFENHLNTLCMK